MTVWCTRALSMVVVAGTAAFYLAGGNAELLSQLYQRFATGPIDWPKPR